MGDSRQVLNGASTRPSNHRGPTRSCGIRWGPGEGADGRRRSLCCSTREAPGECRSHRWGDRHPEGGTPAQVPGAGALTSARLLVIAASPEGEPQRQTPKC